MESTNSETASTAESTQPATSAPKYGVDLSDLDRKFEEFQNAFKRMNDAFVEKMKVAMNGGKQGKDFYTHQPQAVTPIQAAKHLVGKKHVVIVTGAGLSAASGIPTFRGDNGFWTKKYGEEEDPMTILTTRFFKHTPQLLWQWHYDFIELADKCRPNLSHKSLLQFQEYCVKS